MDKRISANRDHWNDLVPVHLKSEMYDVESFKAGKCSLKDIDIEALGDVTGKTLLHLQCHFGQDSISWARRGAIVTGVDFSDKAISTARSLSEELGVNAEFICSNIDNLKNVHSGQYDIVYTSYGVIPWLPDLNAWAEAIYHFLKPGGTFFLAEEHPMMWAVETSDTPGSFVRTYPYFESNTPSEYIGDGSSYADSNARVEHRVTYEWSHSLGGIVTSLIRAGLTLTELREYPFIMYNRFPNLTEGKDGWYRLPPEYGDIPMLFTVKATRG